MRGNKMNGKEQELNTIELVEIAKRIEKPNIEAKIKKFLSQGDKSLREIARALNTTYYQVQKTHSMAWTTVVVHYRTMLQDGIEFQVRMLPYDLTAKELTRKEAMLALEKGEDLAQAIELRVGNSLWLDFDYEQIEGNRQDQIRFFYEKLSLSDFANSVSLNLDFALNDGTFSRLVVFFKQVKKEKPQDWFKFQRRIQFHPLGGRLLAEIDTFGE